MNVVVASEKFVVYYADYRSPDVFARVERAPNATVERLEAIPGVAVVYARIVDRVHADTRVEARSGR